MKAILKKGVESVQHPSGLLKNQISKETLLKDFATYVHTHAHLYENADELKSYLSLKGGKITNAIGKATRAVMVAIDGIQSPAFVANGAKENLAQKKGVIADMLKKKAEQMQKPNVADATTKKGKK